MDDLGRYRIPREVSLGRQVRFEQRRNANRTALLAIGGVSLLCVCLLLGVCGLAFGLGVGPLGEGNLAFALPIGGAPTRTPSASKTPTLVPYGRSARNDAGLSVTVSAYQRPLPAEDIEIPEGQELVLVTVRIENSRKTGAPLKYSPEDFALVTPEGEHFAVNIGGITTGENLQPGELAPGKAVRGDLIFYVYSDVSELQLAWTSADGKTRLFRLTR